MKLGKPVHSEEYLIQARTERIRPPSTSHRLTAVNEAVEKVPEV